MNLSSTWSFLEGFFLEQNKASREVMNVNFTLISGPILSKLLVFVELIITKLCVFFLFTKTPSFINNYDKSDENRNFTIAFDQLEVELIGKRHSRNKKI